MFFFFFFLKYKVLKCFGLCNFFISIVVKLLLLIKFLSLLSRR